MKSPAQTFALGLTSVETVQSHHRPQVRSSPSEFATPKAVPDLEDVIICGVEGSGYSIHPSTICTSEHALRSSTNLLVAGGSWFSGVPCRPNEVEELTFRIDATLLRSVTLAAHTHCSLWATMPPSSSGGEIAITNGFIECCNGDVLLTAAADGRSLDSLGAIDMLRVAVLHDGRGRTLQVLHDTATDKASGAAAAGAAGAGADADGDGDADGGGDAVAERTKALGGLHLHRKRSKKGGHGVLKKTAIWNLVVVGRRRSGIRTLYAADAGGATAI